MKFQLQYKENIEVIDIQEENLPMFINIMYLFEQLTGVHIACYRL